MLIPELKGQVKSVLLTSLALSVICAAVFALLSLIFRFSLLPCVLGVILGFAAAAVGFFVLALNVQRSVEKSSKGAQLSMGLGYILRLAIAGGVIFLAIKLPGLFNLWATAIPLVFPRLAIFIINFTKKGGDKA